MPSGLRCKRLTVCLGLPFGHLLKRADCSKRATQNLFNSQMRDLKFAWFVGYFSYQPSGPADGMAGWLVGAARVGKRVARLEDHHWLERIAGFAVSKGGVDLGKLILFHELVEGE